MKLILQFILIISLCSLATHASANNRNNGWNHSQDRYNFQWSQNNRWSSNNGWNNGVRNNQHSQNRWNSNRGGNNHGHSGGWHSSSQAHSVPELDSTTAPLAGLLLSGLLAAGYERRRRVKLKTIRN